MRKRSKGKRQRKFNPETCNPIGYRAISHRTGIDIAHLSRILNGHRDPRLSTIKRLAKGMGVTIDGLADIIEGNRRRGVPPEITERIREGMRAAAERREGSAA